MKNSKITRVLSIILVSLLIVSVLASCGKKQPSEQPSTTAETTASTTTSEPTKTEPTEFSLFINMTWYWTDQWAGIIPEALEEKTGVRFNVTRATDNKQLGLMIASDDLPDVVYTDVELNRLSDAKYCYDYDDLIAKYTPDWKPGETQVMIARTKSSDGKFYYIPNEVASAEEWRNAKAGAPIFGSLHIRQDILDALGNPALNSLDDLVNIYGMVKEKYPDMVPLVLDPDWKATYFENQLGVPMYYPTGLPVYKTDAGELKYITEHPQYESYLQFMNKLYQKGYVTAENFAFKNASESEAFVTSGKAFTYAHCGNNSVKLTSMGQAADPNTKWVAVDPKLGGDKVRLITSGTGWCGTFITRKNKNPEAMIKMLQFLYSLEGQRLSQWGREGIEWTMGDDGLPKFNDEWKEASLDQDLFYSKYNPAFYFGISPTVEAEGRALHDTEDVKEYNAKVRQLVEIQPELNLSLPAADTEANTILTKLENMRQTEEVKCILSANDAEFKTNFDNLIKQTKTIGVDAINSELNANMAKLKK
jgi:putative aldouronate transport system substrate-binding protein